MVNLVLLDKMKQFMFDCGAWVWGRGPSLYGHVFFLHKACAAPTSKS